MACADVVHAATAGPSSSVENQLREFMNTGRVFSAQKCSFGQSAQRAIATHASNLATRGRRAQKRP
jgi:hypothetical protein